ncbi:MAG: hypothetical protein N2596_08245, partial [Syntrophorhabdaceae bacterium]|nr:hypothetical protein [Syntrophorhabdaceae bacterium]
LESEGAEIVFIDSMKDVLPHDIDGLYIGGGFPELYCDAISRNKLLLKQLEQAIENFMPVYSECGGLMYLSKGIKKAGRIFEMVGIIPSLVEIKSKPQGHGYVVAEVIKENPFFKKQTVIKGHEFHYSTLTDTKGLNFALKVKRGYGIDGKFDGIVYKNMFASYMHIHALSVLGWAKNFVKAAKEYKNRCFYTDVFQKKGVYSHVR